MENIVLITENFNELLFTTFSLDYIENIFNFTHKLLKKYLEESFFSPKTTSEDLLLTKPASMIHNIISFCFEELTFKYQSELVNSINIFLKDTHQVIILFFKILINFL